MPSEMASGSGSSSLTAAYQLYILYNSRVWTKSLKASLSVQLPQNACCSCARADVCLHSLKQLVQVYLLKLAQNLLNELLFQLSLFSAQIFASARSIVAMTVRTYIHTHADITCLHLRIHCRYVVFLGVNINFYSTCSAWYMGLQGLVT